jgi:hypothetical protein
MVVLDAAVVIVALPSIGADLGFSDQGLQWVLSAYTLTFAGLLLLGGRAADLLGRRRVFMVGLLIFTTIGMALALRLLGRPRKAPQARLEPAPATAAGRELSKRPVAIKPAPAPTWHYDVRDRAGGPSSPSAASQRVSTRNCTEHNEKEKEKWERSS